MRLTTYWTAKAHEVKYLSCLPDVGAAMVETNTIPVRGTARAKLPGDPLAMRGVPIQTKGIGGSMRSTRPDAMDFDRVAGYHRQAVA
jgi:hypothetical protein